VTAASGLLLAGGLSGGRAFAQGEPALSLPNEACRPTIRLTAGPYYALNSQLRSDIREDRAGVPLRLSFTVLDDYWCTPIEGATVDVWHSDADGIYSGVVNEFFDHATLLPNGEKVDARDRSYLRGHQVSDSQGRVEFTTIYPGWYSGRLSHIHARAVMPGREQWSAFVTQLFLPPEIDRFVYGEAEPYRARGQNPMTLERDLVLRGDAETLAKVTLRVDREADGLHAQAVLAI
jgi:protocatechuate 3,4-dioxygenase beta subunit